MEVEMKMVKSLLLGSAAGIVAVAGAQAADYPVKAAAVQYVKICNLYGDGFYYLPGTDICVKIGGYARAEVSYGLGASMTNGPFAGTQTNASGLTQLIAAGAGTAGNQSGWNTRTEGNDYVMRSRAYISMDTRQQTEWGTLRTYVNIGLNYDFVASATSQGFSGNRAFIQFAGFTFGLAQSFFDFYSLPLSSYSGWWSYSDTGDTGWKVLAYTANFGGGISSTLSVEEPRKYSIVSTNVATNNLLLDQTPVPNEIKVRYPDIVHNWRIDQAWGSAQIMGALHDASAGYYTPNTFGGGAGLCFNQPTVTGVAAAGAVGVLTGAEPCGHPADKLGWAAGIGSKHNLIPGKDYIQWQATYAQGALKYVAFYPGGNNYGAFHGGTLGYGLWLDGVFGTNTSDVRLTKAWNVNAAYEHWWTPSLRTSVYSNYLKVDYDAQANIAICAMQNNSLPLSTVAATGVVSTSTAAGGGSLQNITNCNNDWGMYNIGSRTQYNFTPAMYVGFDITYSKLLTASSGGTAFFNTLAGTAKPSTYYQIVDQGNWGFRARFHRDILP
jgi:hypothetical protein